MDEMDGEKKLKQIIKKAGFRQFTNPFTKEPHYEPYPHWHNVKMVKNKYWICQCFRTFPELDCEPAYSSEEVIQILALQLGKRLLGLKK